MAYGKVKRTRFSELGYAHLESDVWRFVTTVGQKTVGPYYRTEAQLLADLDRYAERYQQHQRIVGRMTSPAKPARRWSAQSVMEIKTQYQLIEPFRNSGGAAPKYGELWSMALEEIGRNFPVATTRCNAVNYDTKTDRYVASFWIGGEISKVKVTNEVAKFLLTNLRTYSKDGREIVPTAYLHLNEDGACDDVLLVTL